MRGGRKKKIFLGECGVEVLDTSDILSAIALGANKKLTKYSVDVKC